MGDVARWLEPYSWEVVVLQNEALCAQKNALHKPTSDGYDVTRELWESKHREEMGLDDAVALCRACHRLSPFCFFNGNTFASIVSVVIRKMPLPDDTAYLVRSLAGHIVAGVSTPEEEAEFREFCRSLG